MRQLSAVRKLSASCQPVVRQFKAVIGQSLGTYQAVVSQKFILQPLSIKEFQLLFKISRKIVSRITKTCDAI